LKALADKATFTEEMIGKAREEIGRERPARAHYTEMVGSQRTVWLANVVTDWMGDSTWLESLDVWFLRPMFLTETAWISGRVVARASDLDGKRVTIQVEAETFDGEPLSRGTAVVNLPHRDHDEPVWLQRAGGQ
jgi:hypothetical protein